MALDAVEGDVNLMQLDQEADGLLLTRKSVKGQFEKEKDGRIIVFVRLDNLWFRVKTSDANILLVVKAGFELPCQTGNGNLLH